MKHLFKALNITIRNQARTIHKLREREKESFEVDEDEDIFKLRSELERAKQDLLDFQKAQGTDIGKLEREYQLLQEENERLLESVQENSLDNIRICKDMDTLRVENERLREEKYHKETKEIEEQDSNSEVARMGREIERISVQLAQALKERKYAIEALENISKESQQYKQEKTRLEETLDSLHREANENQTLRRENDQIGENLETVASSLRNKTELVKTLQLDVDRLQKEKTQLEGDVGERDRQIHILEKRLSTSLANNLCPDHRDKQVGKPCLACIIESMDKDLEDRQQEIDRLRTKRDERSKVQIGSNFVTPYLSREESDQVRKMLKESEEEINRLKDQLLTMAEAFEESRTGKR